MGRNPCCSKEGLNRGAWTPMEDKILTNYITSHGEGKWRSLPKRAGLKRCGKSCRLRWLNYLRPDIKRGSITPDEEDLIIRLHKLLGNRWSLIAGRLPGRTDNEIKNYWNTNIGKRLQSSESSIPNHQLSANSMSKKSSTSDKSPQDGSPVVRTKASRCSKVFINSDLQSIHNQQLSIVSQVKVASAAPSSEDVDALFIQSNTLAHEGDKHCPREIDMSVKTSTSLSSENSTGEDFWIKDYVVDMSFLNGFLANEFSTPRWNEDVIGTQVSIGDNPNLNVFETNICSPNLSGSGLLFSGSQEHEAHDALKVDAELGSLSMLSFLDSYKSLDWINQDERSN